MILSRKSPLIGICSMLALAAVLLFGNIDNVFAGKETQQTAIRDLAVRSFDIDNNKVKTLYANDVFDERIATEDRYISAKLVAALDELTNEGIFVIGDYRPVFFLEGNNKGLIAIKHADGTISLTDFDISKDKPEKINHRVKEVK